LTYAPAQFAIFAQRDKDAARALKFDRQPRRVGNVVMSGSQKLAQSPGSQIEKFDL